MGDGYKGVVAGVELQSGDGAEGGVVLSLFDLSYQIVFTVKHFQCYTGDVAGPAAVMTLTVSPSSMPSSM